MELRIKFTQKGKQKDKFALMLIQNGNIIPNVYYSTVQHEICEEALVFQIPNYIDVFSLVIQFFLNHDVMVPVNLYSNQDKLLYDYIKYNLELKQSPFLYEKHLYLSFFQISNELIDQLFQNSLVVQLSTPENIASQTLCRSRQNTLSLSQPLLIQSNRSAVTLSLSLKVGSVLYKLFDVLLDDQAGGQAYRLTLTDFPAGAPALVKSLGNDPGGAAAAPKSLFASADFPTETAQSAAASDYYAGLLQELAVADFAITMLTHTYFLGTIHDVPTSQLQLKLGAMLCRYVQLQEKTYEQLKYGTISPICIAGTPALQFVAQILYVDDIEGRSTAIASDQNSKTISFAEKICQFSPKSPKQTMRSYNNLASKNVRKHVSSNSYESSSLWANYMPMCLQSNIYQKKNAFIQLYDTCTYDTLAIGHISFEELMKYFSYSTETQQDIIIQVPLELNPNNYHFNNCTSEQLKDTLFLIAGGIMEKDDIAKYADYEVDDNIKQQLQQKFENNDLELDFSLNIIESESLENKAQNDPIINLDITDDFDQEDDFDNDSPEVITAQDENEQVNDDQNEQITSSQEVLQSQQSGQSIAYDNMVDITSEIDKLYPINQQSPDQVYINSNDLITFQNTFQGDQPFLQSMLGSLQQRKQLQKMAEIEKNLIKTKKHSMKIKEHDNTAAQLLQVNELPEEKIELAQNTEKIMDTCDMELISAIPAQQTPLDVNSILSQLPSSRFGHRNPGTAEYEQDDVTTEQVENKIDKELGLIPKNKEQQIEEVTPKVQDNKIQKQVHTQPIKQQEIKRPQKPDIVKKVQAQYTKQIQEQNPRNVPGSYKPKFLDKYQDDKGKSQVKKQTLHKEQYNYKLNLVKMGPKAQKLLTDSQGETK